MLLHTSMKKGAFSACLRITRRKRSSVFNPPSTTRMMFVILVLGLAGCTAEPNVTSNQSRSNVSYNQSRPNVTSNQSRSNVTYNQSMSTMTSNQSMSNMTSNQSMSNITSNQSMSNMTSNQSMPNIPSNQSMSNMTSNQSMSNIPSNQSRLMMTSNQSRSNNPSNQSRSNNPSNQSRSMMTSNQSRSNMTSSQSRSMMISNQSRSNVINSTQPRSNMTSTQSRSNVTPTQSRLNVTPTQSRLNVTPTPSRSNVTPIPSRSNVTPIPSRSNTTSTQAQPHVNLTPDLEALRPDLTLFESVDGNAKLCSVTIGNHAFDASHLWRPKLEVKVDRCQAQFKCSFPVDFSAQSTKFGVKFVKDGHVDSFETHHVVVPTDIRATPFVTVDEVSGVATTKVFHATTSLTGCYTCVVNDGTGQVASNGVGFRVEEICPIRRNPGTDAPEFTITRQKGCSSKLECVFYCFGEFECSYLNTPDVKFYLVGEGLIPFSKRWFELYTLDSDFVVDKGPRDTRATAMIEIKAFHYMKVKWKCAVWGKESSEIYLQVHDHCPWMPPPPQETKKKLQKKEVIKISKKKYWLDSQLERLTSSAHRHWTNLLMSELIIAISLLCT